MQLHVEDWRNHQCQWLMRKTRVSGFLYVRFGFGDSGVEVEVDVGWRWRWKRRWEWGVFEAQMWEQFQLTVRNLQCSS